MRDITGLVRTLQRISRASALIKTTMADTRELLARAGRIRSRNEGGTIMDTDSVALAAHHVHLGRRIILRQRQLIAKEQALGLSTEQSESLLATFEASQVIFEEHFAALIKERG